MSKWNYVVTAQKATNVTHSCVGNFTGPDDVNLVVAKCTRIEIHLFTPLGLESLLDVPIYGRIGIMQLFRPHGEAQDLLFIVTESCKVCVLQWDAEISELITRDTGDVSERLGYEKQIALIDPDCTMIGLHIYGGLFKVIPLDDKGQFQEAYNIGLEEELYRVLDIKFLYGCSRPTIAVLYQDNKGEKHLNTYEIDLKDQCFVSTLWPEITLDSCANFIIPVPLPYGSVIIIGMKKIAYYSSSSSVVIPIKPSTTEAYSMVDADGTRYLLGDHLGPLHLLVMTHEEERVTGLEIELLGETSIASTISYLHDGFVFVGSSFEDSQLIKLHIRPDAKQSYVDILERYVNVGPIRDFCVVDLEKQGQCQVVTCSGTYKDSSLRVVNSGMKITEQASTELRGIKGIWSLRSSTDDIFDTFLVVSFVNATRILAMNSEDELEDSEIEGFSSQTETLFCTTAIRNQLLQVTSNSVRLVDSKTRKLQNEWKAPSGFSINVATANASQVLLATGGGHLFYLEIGDADLIEVKRIQLDHDVSCLDISPIGDHPNFSKIAAVGMWGDMSVGVLSLPALDFITKEDLGGEIVSRSILLSTFEGVSYLLCALGDGHLFSFKINLSNGDLYDRRKVTLGSQPITLSSFSSRNTAHVFAASDKPTVIHSLGKKLIYNDVGLKQVTRMCPFNSAAFPYSLAIAKEEELTIGTIDENQRLHIQSIPLGECTYCICHQKESRTFAICSMKYCETDSTNESCTHMVRLLDDQSFEFKSTYHLETYECGRSILSCSFSGDGNDYYCVGTEYYLPCSEPTKGRILVFIVEDGKLRLVTERETDGAVHSLRSFNGKLLAAIKDKIQLYKWVLEDAGSGILQHECSHQGHLVPLNVQTRGDFILVGDFVKKSVSVLIYKHEKKAIEELARNHDSNEMVSVEILGDDTYLGIKQNLNLFTLCENNEDHTDEEGKQLKVVGEYHLGEFINRFRHGSLVMRPPDSVVGQSPTVIFGTVNGVIGVIASLPQEDYMFVEKLQSNLTKVIKSVGGLSHAEWRSFDTEDGKADAKNFVDGDLIESFLDLSGNQMEEISKVMEVSVEELCHRVKELTRLH